MTTEVNPGPATFAELNGAAGSLCSCGAAVTHSITVTAAKLGTGRGAMVHKRTGRLCERCAVRLYAAATRNLR